MIKVVQGWRRTFRWWMAVGAILAVLTMAIPAALAWSAWDTEQWVAISAIAAAIQAVAVSAAAAYAVVQVRDTQKLALQRRRQDLSDDLGDVIFGDLKPALREFTLAVLGSGPPDAYTRAYEPSYEVARAADRAGRLLRTMGEARIAQLLQQLKEECWSFLNELLEMSVFKTDPDTDHSAGRVLRLQEFQRLAESETLRLQRGCSGNAETVDDWVPDL